MVQPRMPYLVSLFGLLVTGPGVTGIGHLDAKAIIRACGGPQGDCGSKCILMLPGSAAVIQPW